MLAPAHGYGGGDLRDPENWNREDAAQWAEVYTHIFPAYRLLIESYGKAQEVVKNSEALDHSVTPLLHDVKTVELINA